MRREPGLVRSSLPAALFPVSQGQYILGIKPIPDPAEGQTGNHTRGSVGWRGLAVPVWLHCFTFPFQYSTYDR